MILIYSRTYASGKYLHVAYVFSKVHKSKNNNNKQKFYLVLIIKKDVKHNIRNNKSTTDKQSITDTVMIAAFENVSSFIISTSQNDLQSSI